MENKAEVKKERKGLTTVAMGFIVIGTIGLVVKSYGVVVAQLGWFIALYLFAIPALAMTVLMLVLQWVKHLKSK